ncbi:MAG: ABC transporter permease [Clostridia bacterium]
MYFRAIRNDMVKNKGIAVVSVLFIAASAMLVSLATVLTVNLGGAIDMLMGQAETPHFMQMHSGTLDLERLSSFAREQAFVDEFQVVEFLNVDGALITFKGGSLAGSVQDNGFSVQNRKFDFLLGLDGNPVQVSDGEVYIPITYLQEGLVQAGDRIGVSGKWFTVAGFIRDSQMNSLLSSSKRFLVSERDYTGIRSLGTLEYLIEFRLNDLANLGAFEAAYTSAGMEANGPTITYPLFRMLNGLSDGLMIAVILLVSALVLGVAFLCIRFTLLAKIEDDYREIGVMKAIGLRVSDIKKIYLVHYTAIAAAGSILGFGLSFAFRGALLENIRLYMGECDNSSATLFLAAAGVLLVFLVIIVYVNGVLGRFRKISPAQAVRFGISGEPSAGGKAFRLSSGSFPGTQVFLGMKDVLARKKLYATMLAVLVLAAFIIIVPRNLYHTISSEDFMTYMGTGKSDLRIDLQQTDDIAGKASEIVAVMEKDSTIDRFVVLTTKMFKVKQPDGTDYRLKVELGDHSVFPLAYAEGRHPDTENEIALSAMNAQELGKKIGDTLTLIINGQERELSLSGIYSDVTNGGKAAKAAFSDPSADIMWSVISAGLGNEALTNKKITEYKKRFSYAKVSDIDEFIDQTYGSTISSIGKASYAAISVALSLTVLITLLFMRMLVTRDRYPIAVMKALGFTNTDIRKQYVARSVFVLTAGILLGMVMANTLGEYLAAALIASFGAASFSFVVNPLESCLILPLLMVAAVLAATAFGTRDAGKIRISENIKE